MARNYISGTLLNKVVNRSRGHHNVDMPDYEGELDDMMMNGVHHGNDGIIYVEDTESDPPPEDYDSPTYYDDYDEWVERQDERLRPYDHARDHHLLPSEKQGWDIWEVRHPEDRVKPDPEPLYTRTLDGPQQLDTSQAIPYQSYVQSPHEYYEDGDPDLTESATHRWYTSDDIDPSNLTLHAHHSFPEVLGGKHPNAGDDHPWSDEQVMMNEYDHQRPEPETRVLWPSYQHYRQFKQNAMPVQPESTDATQAA
jgi:hypothetical protein